MTGPAGNAIRRIGMSLPWTRIAVCLLLFLALLKEGATETECPERCVCAQGAVVKCSRLNTFPQDLPITTTKLTISEFEFNDFPVHGLSPFKHLRAIHFQNGHFEHIGACAFDNMVGLETFEIYNATIKTLDKYAFTDINTVTRISIHSSKIGVIRSRAFNNISSVENIEMSQLNVSLIESYAFNNLNNIHMFNFFMNTVNEMLPRAMYHFGNNITLTISSNEFFKLGCQTVDYLMRFGDRVGFYQNKVFCGCQSAWMGRGEAREVLAEFMKKTECLGSQGTYLVNVTLAGFQEKCKDFNGGKCATPDEMKQRKGEACFDRTQNHGTTTISSASQVSLYAGSVVFIIFGGAIAIYDMI